MVLQKMEILPVNDLDIALQDFVNKDEKLAFYKCVQNIIEETRVSILCCIYLLYAFVYDAAMLELGVSLVHILFQNLLSTLS